MPKGYVNGVLRDLTTEEVNGITISDTELFNASLKNLRAKRNALLAETDHLALSDNTLTTEMTTYRQSLRDITNNVTTLDDIDGITWPTKPSS